jgi:cold shock CspA family protein/ribosome-associated translation inhibitor RaiA
MNAQLRIDSRNVVLPESISRRIDRRVAKLERVFSRITDCRLTIDGPKGLPRKGGQFSVTMDLSVPGKEIVVNRHQAGNLAVAIRQTFDAAQRQLEDYSRIRRQDVKRREGPPVGMVVRLFPEEGYGFITDEEGREIYFHRNSVLESGFDLLAPGARVRFAEEKGNDGPQASTVALLG